jgi:hypothetical protein
MVTSVRTRPHHRRDCCSYGRQTSSSTSREDSTPRHELVARHTAESGCTESRAAASRPPARGTSGAGAPVPARAGRADPAGEHRQPAPGRRAGKASIRPARTLVPGLLGGDARGRSPGWACHLPVPREDPAEPSPDRPDPDPAAARRPRPLHPPPRCRHREARPAACPSSSARAGGRPVQLALF